MCVCIHIYESCDLKIQELFVYLRNTKQNINMHRKKYLLSGKSLQGKDLGQHVGYEASVRCSEWRAELGMGRPVFWPCLAYNLQSVSSHPRLVHSHLVLGQSMSICLQGCVHLAALPARLRLCWLACSSNHQLSQTFTATHFKAKAFKKVVFS